MHTTRVVNQTVNPSQRRDKAKVKKKPTLRTTRACDIRPKKTQWLVKDWIPAGRIVLMEGDGGLGKSTVLTDIAAAISRGRGHPLQPDKPLEKGIVLMSITEDSVDEAVIPRLAAAGADMARVHFLDGIQQPAYGPDDEPDQFYLDAHIEQLVSWAEAYQPKMLVIDALFDHLAAVGINDEKEVRQALKPLKDMAERIGVSVLCVRHVRKSGGSAKHQGIGSVAFTNFSRHVLRVFRSSETNEEDGDTTSVLAVSKTNVGKVPKPRRFKLDGWEGVVSFQGESLEVESSRINWGDSVDDMDAEDLAAFEHMPRRRNQSGRPKQSQTAAAELIDSLLEMYPSGAPQAEVRARLEDQAGMSSSSSKHALRRLCQSGDYHTVPNPEAPGNLIRKGPDPRTSNGAVLLFPGSNPTGDPDDGPTTH